MVSSFGIDHTPNDADARMVSSPTINHAPKGVNVKMEPSSSIDPPNEVDARMKSSSSLDHTAKDADARMVSSSTIDHTPNKTDTIMSPSSSLDHTPMDADIYDEVTWADLPTVLLENIYSMLTMRQRFNCSLVCSNWNDVLLAPSLWRTLEVSLTILCACDVICVVPQISPYFSMLDYLVQHL